MIGLLASLLLHSAHPINPNDILTVYPATGGGHHTNVLAWWQPQRVLNCLAKAVADGVATTMTTVVNAQSLGDSMFNSVGHPCSAEDGATVDPSKLLTTAAELSLPCLVVSVAMMGAMSLDYNLKADGLAVGIVGFQPQNHHDKRTR